jgi:hypothetical protein
MFVAIIAPVLTAAVITVLTSLVLPSPASAARWKICGIVPRITCTTACSQVIASFPTYEACAAAKKTMRFAQSKTKKVEKSAGAAGLAVCKKRYGKNVTNAAYSSDGKTLNSYSISNDPIVMRDACKKRWGPMAQIRWHRGQLYCARP